MARSFPHFTHWHRRADRLKKPSVIPNPFSRYGRADSIHSNRNCTQAIDTLQPRAFDPRQAVLTKRTLALTGCIGNLSEVDV
jgi:hypothetical protein